MQRHLKLVLAGSLAIATIACGEPINVAAPSDPTTATTAVGDGAPPTETTLAESPNEVESPPPERTTDTTREGTVPTTIVATTTTTEVASADAGEVPADFIDAVLDHTASLTGAALSELTVVGAAAHEWPDGSLGCPEPDQVYTQAITPGYRVVVGHGTDRYDYRINESGYFRLCQGQRLSSDNDS